MNMALQVLFTLFWLSTLLYSSSADLKVISHGRPRFRPTVQKAKGNAVSLAAHESSQVSASYVKGPYNPIGIYHHGGPTMSTGVNIYIIWYGTWKLSSKNIIRNFIYSLGPENADVANSVRRWWKITGLYYNTKGKYLSQSIVLKKQVFDKYSMGKYISESGLEDLIINHANKGNLPLENKGLYFILTSADVKVESFCSDGCGYHKYFDLSGVPNKHFKYAFVGNPKRCPDNCTVSSADSPNNDAAADAMISTISHEITEATTDPVLNAWYRYNLEQENADLCAWKYGKTYRNKNGKRYNLVGRYKKQYLVEANWNPKTGKCVKNA